MFDELTFCFKVQVGWRSLLSLNQRWRPRQRTGGGEDMSAKRGSRVPGGRQQRLLVTFERECHVHFNFIQSQRPPLRQRETLWRTCCSVNKRTSWSPTSTRTSSWWCSDCLPDPSSLSRVTSSKCWTSERWLDALSWYHGLFVSDLLTSTPWTPRTWAQSIWTPPSTTRDWWEPPISTTRWVISDPAQGCMIQLHKTLNCCWRSFTGSLDGIKSQAMHFVTCPSCITSVIYIIRGGIEDWTRNHSCLNFIVPSHPR